MSVSSAHVCKGLWCAASRLEGIVVCPITAVEPCDAQHRAESKILSQLRSGCVSSGAVIARDSESTQM